MAELYRSDIVDVDIGKSLLRTYAGIVLNTGDCKANRFGANIIRAGEPVDISGCTVLAYFMRPNTETLPIPGVVEGNTVYVDLPAACYTQDGTFSLAIKVSSTDITQTVRVIDGCIRLTQTDNIIDPGEVVPSLDELFAKIADMEAATAEAKQATAKAEEATAANERRTIEAIVQVNTTLADAMGDLSDALTEAGPAITQEASGEIVAVTDAAARPVVGMVSEINAVQTGSGEPTPDNIRPIIGFDTVRLTRSGKNMLDVEALDQVEINPGEIRWGKRYTRPGAYAVSANVAGSDSDYIYAKVVDGAGATVGSTMYLVAGSAIKSYNVTLTDGQTLIVWYVRDLDEETVKESMLRTQVQVENGSKTAYEIGQSATLNAELPEVVYGGSLDWATGGLTVEYELVTLDGGRIGYVQSVNDAGIVNVHFDYAGGWVTEGMQISHFYYLNKSAATTTEECFLAVNGSLYLRIARDRLGGETWADVNAYLRAQVAAGTPVQVLHRLNEPRTMQLDPQTLALLRGENRIWSEAGASVVGYIADTQMYVDTHGGSGGDAGFAEYAAYAERAGEADNALAVGGLQVQAVPITDWDTITPDAGTVYLVYDPEVTG